MFNYKSRKQLKDEIASLEKQLEIRGEQVKELEEEKRGLKDRKDHIELKYLEEGKRVEELRVTIEDRNNVVEYWKKDCLKYRKLFNDKEEALKELKDLEQRAKRKVINLETTLERRDGVIKILEKDKEELEKDKQYFKRRARMFESGVGSLRDEIDILEKRTETTMEKVVGEWINESLEKQLKILEQYNLRAKEYYSLDNPKNTCKAFSIRLLELIKKLEEENKQLKEKNKKLNDAMLTVKGIEPDRVWANIAYVKE